MVWSVTVLELSTLRVWPFFFSKQRYVKILHNGTSPFASQVFLNHLALPVTSLRLAQ
jgi:hypothetical protein